MISPACPYLECDKCDGRVEGLSSSGPPRNYPCGDAVSYHSICPSWGPVDGCRCQEHLGYRPHSDPKPATAMGLAQGPI